MIRQIFIDCGAHIGESVHYFRKHYDPDHVFEVICFEPLPENIEKLKKIQGVRVMPYAISTIDDTVKFYTGLPQSGSLSDQKRTGGLDGDTHIMVDTINFAYWFNRLVSGDYVPEITIKMNVEGAEYEVIDRMNQWGLLPFVHKWYVQWHWQKIGLDKEEHDRISSLIKWEPWGAMYE